MPNITYTNSNGQSVVLGDTAPLIVTAVDGIGGINNVIYRSKGQGQDGTTITGSSLDERQLIIEGVILAQDKDTYRRQLLQAFNPKLTGTLRFERGDVVKEISCQPELAPVFPSEYAKPHQVFSITLLCPSPFWTDISVVKSEIATWLGDFSFPLTILTDGIELGHRSPGLFTTINNTGDVEIGMRVVFSAIASVKNPALIDVNTQEYFKLNYTMTAGELITLETSFGAKRITSLKNGITTNIFNSIDLGSTFLQLAVGENLFRYNADLNIDNLEVSIFYTLQYLGV